ncbi:MAG: hypothetical protein BGN86_11025 [Caulobacterales bacterium 68-7]|nr:hypothetical protein [Caulobacterales bacterium]OJU13582.1 MAG: hypothetical protein BGN86_11025 [Caulobacterales bacterium 68-7]
MIQKSFPLAVVLALSAELAQAQEYVRPDCLGVVQPSASLKFDTPEHAIWYRRFWTGSCRNLPMMQCMPGNPNWNDVVGKLVKRGRPDQSATILSTACRMGQTIGHEWSRERAVRRISTDDLKTYMATLDEAPDVTTGLSRVELKVKTAMAGAR